MITREEAWSLLCEYNKEPFHLRHGEVVEGCMRYFARQLGYGEEEEFWGIVGLLHDLDFEQWPEEHCQKCREIMRERGLDELASASAREGFGRSLLLLCYGTAAFWTAFKLCGTGKHS